MSYTLIGVSLAVAALDWLAVFNRWNWLEYVAKPGVMLALIAWLWSAGGFQGTMIWFTCGAVFSLVGDVLLMLPKEQFIAGLISFLLAHLAYIVGLNQTLPPIHLASAGLLILVLLPKAQFYRRISLGLVGRDLAALRTPILVYTLTVGAMLLSALLTLVRPDNEWRPWPSLLVSAGALSFFLSDILLAWSKFVSPIPAGRLKVMVTYHLGQLGILIGAALNYLG